RAGASLSWLGSSLSKMLEWTGDPGRGGSIPGFFFAVAGISQARVRSHLDRCRGATVADPRRFEQVALPHLNAAYNLARWLLRNDHDAEDAVQEACLRALKYIDNYRGENPRAWLLAIVRNACFDRMRS